MRPPALHRCDYVDGGYAEFAIARADFTYPLPTGIDDLHAAPLLCAASSAFARFAWRAWSAASALAYGYGASAHLALPVLRAWGCEVYVATADNPAAPWPRTWGPYGQATRPSGHPWRSTGP